MKTIGKIGLLLGIGFGSFTVIGQEMAVEGSATIQSELSCTAPTEGVDCEPYDEVCTIVWTHSSIKITRADGSVTTLPLTRHMEEEEGTPGSYHRHVYSTTDLVSGTAHAFEITVYEGTLPTASFGTLTHEIRFTNGNKEGEITTFYGNIE